MTTKYIFQVHLFDAPAKPKANTNSINGMAATNASTTSIGCSQIGKYTTPCDIQSMAPGISPPTDFTPLLVKST